MQGLVLKLRPNCWRQAEGCGVASQAHHCWDCHLQGGPGSEEVAVGLWEEGALQAVEEGWPMAWGPPAGC